MIKEERKRKTGREKNKDSADINILRTDQQKYRQKTDRWTIRLTVGWKDKQTDT